MVQTAISEFDRQADSSNVFVALWTATTALADREGTRAMLFMTDAETGDGGDVKSELWRALQEVRPRVFTFEISSGGNAGAQDLMQDWAAVNSGVYDMAAGVGDFDAGFERTSCLLRRPKLYVVEVEVTAAEPPGPGTLTVTQPAGSASGAAHVIFDASGSMGSLLPSGEPRIDAARQALSLMVEEMLEEGTLFSLRAFRHVAPSSCETRLEVPLAPLDRGSAARAVTAIAPKLLSQTALADSLSLVIDDVARANGPVTVILITDGEEPCGGDPGAAAEVLKAGGEVAIAIVSLALEPAALRCPEVERGDQQRHCMVPPRLAAARHTPSD